MKPIIGILTNIKINKEDSIFSGELQTYTTNDYIDIVKKAGGIPLLIPLLNNEDIDNVLSLINGLIVSGGADIDPLLYNENPIQQLGYTNRILDEFYLDVIHHADESKIPILGICKGHQMLNIAYNGTLYQDLPSQMNSMKHVQNTLRYIPTHKVKIKENTFLYDLFNDELMVNSFHHQGIKDLSNDFHTIASSDDGVIEAIEKNDGTYMLGLQWHPEMMQNEDMIKILEYFLDKCRKEKV
jgi:putative glutamine amidotransferase